ncbi:MAG: signal peptidase I [Elusimicrobiota bacterium]|jgi:signal peptidase I
MEERLFWIGAAMGLYAWATKRWMNNGRLDRRWAAAAWHSVFFGLAGFAVALVALLSFESRRRGAGADLFSASQLLPAAGIGVLAGFFGFWRAWSEGDKAEKRNHILNEDQEWAETVFSAVILAAVLMYFVVQAFKIPSGSMESTLRVGDHLFVNKFIYGVRIPLTEKRVLKWKKVERGDIVVFRFPTEDASESHCGGPQYGKDFIKRVIGLPGDRVEIRSGQVSINGQPAGQETYAQYLDPMRLPKIDIPIKGEEYQGLWSSRRLDSRLGDTVRDNFGPVSVPEGEYFMMGDNRDRSCDGRYWGPVQQKYLKGKAWLIYWPPSRMGKVS